MDNTSHLSLEFTFWKHFIRTLPSSQWTVFQLHLAAAKSLTYPSIWIPFCPVLFPVHCSSLLEPCSQPLTCKSLSQALPWGCPRLSQDKVCSPQDHHCFVGGTSRPTATLLQHCGNESLWNILCPCLPGTNVVGGLT